MERIQRGPNPLLPNLPLITATTTEMWHFKPRPTHRTFSTSADWRHLLVCSLHLQKTLSKWNSGTAIGPSSSDTFIIVTTSLASQTLPGNPVWFYLTINKPKCDILHGAQRRGEPASLPNRGSALFLLKHVVIGNKNSTNRKHRPCCKSETH